MGRKTNSVGLRLKKTNKDYNHCWYSDILYTDNFSKSLQISNYLSQTFKTIAMPCPQTSVIGAFKKANLLVCYLDKKKRKAIENSTKGSAQKSVPQPQKQDIKQDKKKVVVDPKEQETPYFNFLYKPCREIFETNFSKFHCFNKKMGNPLGVYLNSKQISTDSVCFHGFAKEQKQLAFSSDTLQKSDIIVKEKQKQKSKNVKAIMPMQMPRGHGQTAFNFNSYRGSVGLELLQVTDFDSTVSVQNQKANSNNNSNWTLEPYFGSFKTQLFISDNFSLKASFFLNPPFLFKKLRESPPLDDLNDYKTKGLEVEGEKNQLVLQKQKQRNFDKLGFLPNFPEKSNPILKVWSEFPYFSNFFYNERFHIPLICGFSKNFQLFGKKTGKCNPLSPTSFLYLSELVSSNLSQKNTSNKKAILSPLVCKKSSSKTSLYHFYKSFSCFWENVVCLAFYKSTNEISCALFLADTVSYLLEKKTGFRSIKRQLLLELNQPKNNFEKQQSQKTLSGYSTCALGLHTMSSSQWNGRFFGQGFQNKKKITGVRICCSGRVGGRSKKAQRSRKDTFMWGETGLHVFSNSLDFAKTHAETPFGVIGVQVWVCTKQ